jgi:Zn-finger nucleic acid-binding protein
MNDVRCPICEATIRESQPAGDATLFVCPRCGGYRLSGTAMRMLELGSLQRPQPQRFAELVKQKRGRSSDYPTITSGDLGG